MAKISVVVNALNAAEDIETALKSIRWADEIVVVDDGSRDETIEIAKKYTKKIYHHKSVGYVEPARNFAIGKATSEWILILDTDEEVPASLAERLKQIATEMKQINYVELPRQNIIFNKWMKASMWWPDYNIRFFKKGMVTWENTRIHRPPKTSGEGIKLPTEERLAIVHYHYTNVSQFIERLNRYTSIQAKELVESGYKFKWNDLLTKPLGEFLGRYFANRGFEDGLHGLSLSLLQAFSFLVMYLKVWGIERFPEQVVSIKELKEIKSKSSFEINYWFKYGALPKNPLKRFLQKVINKVS